MKNAYRKALILAIAAAAIAAAPQPALSQTWSSGSSGAIYYNGGNVGIGTATPAAPLHISVSGSESWIRLTAAGPLWTGIQFENTSLTGGVRWVLYNGVGGTASDAIGFYNYAAGKDSLTITSAAMSASASRIRCISYKSPAQSALRKSSSPPPAPTTSSIRATN